MKTPNLAAVRRLLTAACLCAFQTAMPAPKALELAEERTTVQRALESAPAFAEITRGKRKIVVVQMLEFSVRPAEGAAEEKIVESLHFSYDDGKTIRSTFNRATNAVVKVEEMEAYPTPLAPEEEARAKELAREKDAKVRALFAGTATAELKVTLLAPVVAEKTHPLYGKRLAIVRVAPRKELAKTVQVTINLTDETVVP